jgi:hypothetical protein
VATAAAASCVFFEHVASPRRAARALQRAADATVWPRLSGGGHLARNTDRLVAGAGWAAHARTDQRRGASGFLARIVEPRAPYFAALRRVSSNAERAYVSTSSPWVMSV